MAWLIGCLSSFMIFYRLVWLINFFKQLSVSGMLFEVQCSNGVLLFVTQAFNVSHDQKPTQ